MVSVLVANSHALLRTYARDRGVGGCFGGMTVRDMGGNGWVLLAEG